MNEMNEKNEMKRETNSMPQAEPNEVQKPKKNGLVTAGLVLGIIGTVISVIPIVNNASFVLGILALVFGAVALVKKKAKGKAVAALVLGIVAVVVTLVMQIAVMDAVDSSFEDLDEELAMMNGERTDDVLRDSLDVTIGSFQVSGDEYWEETKVEVTVKNKSDKRQSFDVTIEAVDKSGNRLDVDYIYVSDLGAGQSQKVDIFTFVTSDQIANMKNATFRVVEASAY